jgi:hypothetical protein
MSEFGGGSAELYRCTGPVSDNLHGATNLPWAVAHGPSSTVFG